MGVSLLIDFGSTYTKIRAVDLARETLVGVAQAPSSVATDMTIGLQAAYRDLSSGCNLKDEDIEAQLASSSAAGGLGIAVIGLVPNLTTDAARKAAFGAGGRVVASYSNKLTREDTAALVRSQADLVLLAGGTDGGNEQVVRHNYRQLAASQVTCPVLYAGNRVVAEEAEQALRAQGKTVIVTDNIMPELNELSLEPVHRAIRALFIDSIIHGKGLDKAEKMIGGIIMPTPLAVLRGAELLAGGTEDEAGLGDLLVVDVGGATTDINSLAEWRQINADVMQKGLPEPYAFRTVEGDLGIRYNASHILQMVGSEELIETMQAIDPASIGEALTPDHLRSKIFRLTQDTASTPGDDTDHLIDAAISYHAVRIAVKRHAGRLEPHHTADGTVYFQYGKDLGGVTTVIATGGVFKYGRYRQAVLQAVRAEPNDPHSLRPKQPGFVLDNDYLLYAAGLLADIAPDAALRICKRHLERVGDLTGR